MPTLAQFILFVQNVMGISSSVLPTTSPIITYAFNLAYSIVNPALATIPVMPPGATTWTIYEMATYNLAGDTLLNFAQDQPGAPNYMNELPFFAYFRQLYRLNNFTPGVVATAADESTSGSLATPEFMRNITVANLQNLRTPYGRQYLAFAQAYGPAIWGVS